MRVAEETNSQDFRDTPPDEMTSFRLCVALALLVYVFFFVWRQVDTRLLYHADTVVLAPQWWITFPCFQTGWTFFGEQLAEPGGGVRYLGAFLAQLFYDPAAGALVFTLLATGLLAGTMVLARALRLPRYWAASLVSPLVVLGIASAYLFPLAELVGISIALLATAIYTLLPADRTGVFPRALTFLCLCPLVYWVAGATCLVFVMSCGLLEWRIGENRGTALLYTSIGCLVVVCGTYFVLTHRSDAGFHFTWGQFVNHLRRALIPTAAYAAQLLVVLSWSRIAAWRAEQSRSTGGPDVHVSRDQWYRDALISSVLVGLTLLVSFGILDTESRVLLRANYLARRGQWSELLEEVTLHPPPAYAPCLLYDINRALYENGELLDRMFQFPQSPEFLIQVGSDAVPYRGCQELLLSLGCVNEAEHTAFEALEVRGPHPYILRELITINILKDRPEVARVFLNILKRDIIHGRWAAEYLHRLQRSERMESDAKIRRIRRLMISDDQIRVPNHCLFDLLLEENPRNRMALEYQTAYWLLTCQLDKVCQQLPAVRALGFDHVPTNYAEALLMNWRMTGTPPALDDWRIEAETKERFQAFVELTRGSTGDPVALAQMTAGTYYQYFFAQQAMHQ